MLNNTYVVSITELPLGDPTLFVDALAQALNAQEAQIHQVLERLKLGPVTVTKPISETPARAVAQQLERLGFKTHLRVVESTEAGSQTPAQNNTQITSSTITSNTSVAAPISAPPQKRSSLSNRILLSTLIPLLVLIAAILGFTSLSLPNTVRQLILEGADQLAIAVGNNIVLNDPGGENRRLTLITQQPKVFFVKVDLPDGSSVFRAKNPDDEIVVRNPLTTFINDNPDGGTYAWKDNRATAFETVLKQMQSSGQASADGVKSVQANINRTAPSAGRTTTLEIRRIGFAQQNGVRQVVPVPEAQFIVTVGVIADASLEIRNNFLLIFGVVALLATLLIVFIVSAALRRVVQPILEMSRVADRISLGELEQPVPHFGNDELGDLAQSIDRLRISVKVLVDRTRNKRS
jgi:HAMP domain-containing protein